MSGGDGACDSQKGAGLEEVDAWRLSDRRRGAYVRQNIYLVGSLEGRSICLYFVVESCSKLSFCSPHLAQLLPCIYVCWSGRGREEAERSSLHLFILFIPHDDENTYHLFVCRCPVQRALPHLPCLYGQGTCLSLLPTEDGYRSLPLAPLAYPPRPRATLPTPCPRLSPAGALPTALCRAGTTRAFRHSRGVLRDPSQGLEDAYSMGAVRAKRNI